MGIKFIEISHLDINNENAVVTVSSGSSLRNRMRDRRYTTQWSSNGSDDSTTETIEVDFGVAVDVDFIQLLNFNWKAFTIKYDVAGTPTDFSVPIAETVNAEVNSLIYDGFTPVSTQKIYIEIDSTIVADAEKVIGELLISKVLGELVGYPGIKPTISRNKIVKTMLRGKKRIVDADTTIGYSLSFKTYPNTADMQLMETLFNRRNPFHVLISGGDESQFTDPRMGYRDRDIRLMSVSSTYSPTYYKNLYYSGVDFTFDLVEV